MSQNEKSSAVKSHQTELSLGKPRVFLTAQESYLPLGKGKTVPCSNVMYCSCCRRPRGDLPVTDPLRLSPVKSILNQSWKSKVKTFHKTACYSGKKSEQILNCFVSEAIATGATLDAPDALEQNSFQFISF